MKLHTLSEVNIERAARRPVIVITDTANGEQRLVKAKDIAADPQPGIDGRPGEGVVGQGGGRSEGVVEEGGMTYMSMGSIGPSS